ncbi:MAG: phosphatase PAP2 family protein [Eubacterium sp.]|nr:phosphatase PAP2 family protein [Eubacterium sp.]
MKKFLKKYIDPMVPLWAIPPLVICFIVNCAIYWLTMLLCGDLYHYDLTLDIDRRVPLVTEWVFVYLGYCYVFWFFSYCYVAKVHRKRPIQLFRFVIADVMSRLICMIFFIFLPTTNVRPEIVGTDISDKLTRFLYTIDQPTNLFPSIHCLVSWLCFIGIRRAKNVPLWFKFFSAISAVVIMISTQFLKQHYIADVISGVALAELCYWISGHMWLPVRIRKIYENFIIKHFHVKKLE